MVDQAACGCPAFATLSGRVVFGWLKRRLVRADVRGVQSLLPLLTVIAFAGVGFMLVTMVCYTLAAEMKHEIDRHELIREARVQRAQYLAQLARRINGNAGADDATPAIVGEITPEAEAAESGEEPPLAAAA